MIKLDLKAIQEHLANSRIEGILQPETNQLYFLKKIGQTDFPVFIRIFDTGELLQLLAFLPCTLMSESANDTARLLHMLNKEMDLPGFGMDENSRVVFYRCMLPVKNKAIDPLLLDAYLNSLDLVCQSFAPVITAVAHRTLTLDEVLKEAQNAQNAQNKPPQEK